MACKNVVSFHLLVSHIKQKIEYMVRKNISIMNENDIIFLMNKSVLVCQLKIERLITFIAYGDWRQYILR